MIVGGICVVFEITLLYILASGLDINYLGSSIIAFISAVFLNYFLCIIWVFKVRKISNKIIEFCYYMVINSVGLIINTIVIYSLTELIGLYFIISKILALFFTYAWNFLARKKILH